MIKYLITTIDYIDLETGEKSLSFTDHEKGSMKTEANEEIAERITDYLLRYKNHDEVRVKFSILHKNINRLFSGVMLRSIRFPEQIKYGVQRDIEILLNHT